MNEDKPFQPLRTPAAVIISAFTVIALTDMYGADTESASFDLTATIVTLILWMTSIGAAAWNSPQAQGAASAVFAITALIGERMPTSSEHNQDDLSRISPTLWVLSGIMCGSAVATCDTINRMGKSLSTPRIKDQLLERIGVAILVSILASAPLISSSHPRLWVSSGQLGTAITAFLCGFAMTSFAGLLPFTPPDLPACHRRPLLRVRRRGCGEELPGRDSPHPSSRHLRHSGAVQHVPRQAATVDRVGESRKIQHLSTEKGRS